MSALEPLYAALLPAGGGGTLYLAFKFLQWIRGNRVEDGNTTLARLDAENKRQSARADAAEADVDRVRGILEATRQQLFYEQEYSAGLRRQLVEGHIQPNPRQN